MILNGEYVEKLTDEELCMLEQITYLDEDVAKAAGIGNSFIKIARRNSAPCLPHIVTKNCLKILKITRNQALKSGCFSAVFA